MPSFWRWKFLWLWSEDKLPLPALTGPHQHTC
ncbi:rCG59862 [Rattus norvegicus]|uniref:RCG59862 n=1 Tax=Rattus norvegicus TaxID=10116 RepID=A6HSF2_RAT|nr:rCG59862 [Rattus norvegicus]